MIDEFDQLGEIAVPSKAAKVHGVLTSLSPMKVNPGKVGYFEGKLADETCSLRIVGFNTSQQRQLSTNHDQHNSITLNNCEIQKSKYGEQMEVLLKSSTAIATSPKKIQIDTIASTSSHGDAITLSQLQTESVILYQSVQVSIKVLQIKAVVEVKPGLSKQDITVADGTSSARLTLWHNNINKLTEGKSYELREMVVNHFNGVKYLSPPRSTPFSFTLIEDIDDVMNVPEDDPNWNTITNAVVATVSHFTKGKLCITATCRGKVEPRNNVTGRCIKCSSVQRLDKCSNETSVTLLIAYDGQSCALQAYLPIIKIIAGNDSITEESMEDEVMDALAVADPFSLTFNTNNVIVSAFRE